MTKYVIDLPDGISAVVAKKPYFLNETDVMRIPASQLEMYVEPAVAENTTVEKRVIELPDYVIVELETIKEDNGNDNLQGFMNDVNDDDEIWQSVEQFNSSGMPTDALIGEWWLEHVEFVPKKEHKFYVVTDFGTLDARDQDGKNIISFEKLHFLNQHGHYYEFTGETADELVDGLTALNARKVEVED